MEKFFCLNPQDQIGAKPEPQFLVENPKMQAAKALQNLCSSLLHHYYGVRLLGLSSPLRFTPRDYQAATHGGPGKFCNKLAHNYFGVLLPISFTASPDC